MTRLLLVVVLLGATLAPAEELLRSDFQQGRADPWGAAGSGDVRLSTYQGNVSMRITAGASAQATVPATGKRHLYVKARIAADALDDKATCIAEASRDKGHTWMPIFSIGRAHADAVTLWSGGQALPERDGNLLLRLSARGTRATCWFDDIIVSGVPKAETPVTRQALDRAMLESGAGFDRPVDLSAFAPSADATGPLAQLTGHLHLDATRMPGFRTISEEHGYERGPATRSLPELDVDLVQHGDVLIPAQRGLIPSTHAAWNWIIEPGRVWSEPNDHGLSRAALPFALQERNANCTHNGMLGFLFNEQGIVGKVAFEIAGETCRYRKFDAWGFIAASRTPARVPDAQALIQQHDDTVAARLPVRPVETLPEDTALALATAAGPEPTVYGAVLDGIHYRSSCATRHGDYPACESIDLPSYSTAKSIFAAVALMRLERLYPGVAASAVTDQVAACARVRSWTGVTLEQALDMATGHFRSTAYMADEDDPSIAQFFESVDHAAKIRFACNHYPRKSPPGTRWAYHTSDTYLLGTAMTAILRARQAPGADLYDDLLLPLWTGLKLSPTLSTTRRTEDAVAQPFVGWGLTFQPDDIVRIARWLMHGAGELLDQRLLDAAMQRVPTDGGLPAGFPDFRYRAGFWARDIGGLLGCSAQRWIPAMSGFGGISVAMLPARDTLFYSFGDSNHWDWGAAAIALTGPDDPCH